MFSNFILDPLIKFINTKGDNNAFCINEIFYSYTVFGEKISAIRNAITNRKFDGTNVGLVVNDDIETYASIFALWLDGFAYVPLHPQQPIDRNQEIISQSEISLVLSSNNSSEFGDTQILNTNSLAFEKSNLEPAAVSDDVIAYILFTSGSTGKPKGVPITRKNLAAFMDSFWQSGITISETDRCLQAYELTFDLSVQSYLVPLTTGACTYTVPHSEIKYSYVFGLLDDHELTLAPLPPSLIRYLKPYFKEIDLPKLRYTLLGAEASAVDLILEWSLCAPNAAIFNYYGPTEATIYCTHYLFPTDGSAKHYNGMMAIGRPMKGITAIIVDENNSILAQGERGELCVTGLQLTSGYWQNPQKNADVFFEMEYNGQIERFYKTGDSCFIDEDGDVLYCGRLDYQVKVQGYRVELGEIEFHTRMFQNGQNAVAIANETASLQTEIVLFVEGLVKDEASLVAYLRSKLPAYMIPAKVIAKEIFELNRSGKIDRNLLKDTLKQ